MAGAYYLAYSLRFDWAISFGELANFSRTVIWIVPVKLVCFFFFGMYKGMWRYTSIQDLKNLIKACITSSVVIVLVLLLAVRFVGFPRTIFPLDFVLTIFLTGAWRIGIRLYYYRGKEPSVHTFLGRNSNDGKRLLIIGAGDAGEKVLRELRDNPKLSYEVVGFVDDDSLKKGRAIHDAPILGGVDTLPQLVKENRIEEMLIAVPSATSEQMRKIVEVCNACSVPCKTLPGIGELIDGKVSVKALRDVDYHDLLGRPPVALDLEAIGGYITDRCVLITGAGGSIGSELCRQIVRFNPETVVLMDASEENLYRIQMELKHRAQYLHYVTVLGKVQNRGLVEKVFLRYAPQVVFHAAAYKHVPMLERNPWEAIFNNIVGTNVVMDYACKHKVGSFILISTDKAVRPTNVMGATKRVCEMLLQSRVEHGAHCMAVRFGNVAGSSGSVIPLFRNQIAMGGPITITHPEITRFFMTIPEASQLILQAGAFGTDGEIFILEMGTPVKIADMARDLIRLSGKEPDRDIEIIFTGLRAGEKLYEELITDGEGIVTTQHKGIMVLREQRAEKYSESIDSGVEELVALAGNQDGPGIQAKLKELVPEYTPQKSEGVV